MILSDQPTQSTIEIPVWNYAYGGPGSLGTIKSKPADFIVEEQLPFEPEGAGEHVFLQIQKCGENTDYVARMLARFAAVRQRDVSYAGIKDRHAKTVQWFSVWLPGKDDPDWNKLETENIKICQVMRHARKLKRGVLSGNDFQITIRQWEGNGEAMESQLLQIKEQGFPNYFGVQRFGHQGKNVSKALTMFQGEKVKREQRSIYLSAVRSYFFNQLLAKRISLGNWNQAVSGDVCVFDCSNSFFSTDQIDDSITQRVKTGVIHPAGLLFGQQDSETKNEAWNIEQDIFHTNLPLTKGLIEYGMTSGRRAFRVFPTKFEWEFLPEMKVVLKFSLPAGSYATSLLRELVII